MSWVLPHVIIIIRNKFFLKHLYDLTEKRLEPGGIQTHVLNNQDEHLYD